MAQVAGSAQATLPTSAATGQIDLAQLTLAVQQSASALTSAAIVLRQIMVIGDPTNAGNVASVIPDEMQGWESGMVVQLAHSRQLREISDRLLLVLRELQQLNINLGGLPATDQGIS